MVSKIGQNTSAEYKQNLTPHPLEILSNCFIIQSTAITKCGNQYFVLVFSKIYYNAIYWKRLHYLLITNQLEFKHRVVIGQEYNSIRQFIDFTFRQAAQYDKRQLTSSLANTVKVMSYQKSEPRQRLPWESRGTQKVLLPDT